MNALISVIMQATIIKLGIELLEYATYVKHFSNLSRYNFWHEKCVSISISSHRDFREYAIIPLMVSSFPYLAGSIIQGEFIYHVSVISNRFEQINTLFEKINQEARRRHAPLTVFDIESEGKKQERKSSVKAVAVIGGAAANKTAMGMEQKLGNDMKAQKVQPSQMEDDDAMNTSDEEDDDDDIFDEDNANETE